MSKDWEAQSSFRFIIPHLKFRNSVIVVMFALRLTHHISNLILYFKLHSTNNTVCSVKTLFWVTIWVTCCTRTRSNYHWMCVWVALKFEILLHLGPWCMHVWAFNEHMVIFILPFGFGIPLQSHPILAEPFQWLAGGVSVAVSLVGIQR